MLKWILDVWQQLPPGWQKTLEWLFDKHLGEVITAVTGLPALWLLRRKIIDVLDWFRPIHRLLKRLSPAGFSIEQIERETKYYIWPECQRDMDPAKSDEPGGDKIAGRKDLCSTIDNLLMHDTAHKHYILLADTGMGKSSFLLNYFARHLWRWHKPFKMELIPLGEEGLLEDCLIQIHSPGNTVLLLDAFDEDIKAIQDHAQRLSEIVRQTRKFYRVFITCRTQFFPRDEEIPQYTDLLKPGPHRLGDPPQYVFDRLYLSPFSDQQIRAYLDCRFPIQQRHQQQAQIDRRQQAQAIVDKIPNLVVRPILLDYIDDLIVSDKPFENCYQIYTAMVDAWLERERAFALKRDRPFIKDIEALRKFSNKLAIELFANREKRGSGRIPYGEIEPTARLFGIKLDTWQLAGRSLLNRDAEGNYKFAHRSFLEFLFAQQLIDGDQEALQVPIKYWTEQLKLFLVDGCRSPWRFPITLRSAIFFVDFKGGTFQLGKTGKTVKVKPFAMSIYPVTNREYEEFDPSHREKRDKYSDQDDQPVVRVSWEDAVRYCQWLSEKTGEQYRLPTEAEWEFAASGGGQRQYPWGNEEPGPKRANYSESKIGKTTPVGSYPLGMTPEGLFDMAGNVWEWCDDWYDEDKENSGRVVRGGSFYLNDLILRCAARSGIDPLLWNLNCGFRVVRGPSSCPSEPLTI